MIAIPQQTDLCRLAERHDTDKGTQYTQVYDRLLSHVRERPLRMLEIGLYNGGSFRMWRDYFPNAELHGIDIDPRTLAYEHEVPNSKVRLIDQSDPRQLDALISGLGGNYDFILDDGGHTMEQQIVSFEVLWPHVVPGGVYAIEDLGTSYFVDYGGRDLYEPDTALDYTKRLVDAVNREHMRPPGSVQPAVPAAKIAQLRRDVASVHFHPGIALMVKTY